MRFVTSLNRLHSVIVLQKLAKINFHCIIEILKAFISRELRARIVFNLFNETYIRLRLLSDSSKVHFYLLIWSFFFSQIVANSTFNNELMSTDLTLMDGTSKLVIGEGFVGCMLEGPSLIFNNSISEKYNIEWGRCSHVPCKYSVD